MGVEVTGKRVGGCWSKRFRQQGEFVSARGGKRWLMAGPEGRMAFLRTGVIMWGGAGPPDVVGLKTVPSS